MATTWSPFFRNAFKTGVTSDSSIAISPAMAAPPLAVGTNAAQVFKPMRADRSAHLRDLEIIASDSDLVHRAGLFPHVTNDLCKLGCIKSRSCWCWSRWWRAFRPCTDKIKCRFDTFAQIGSAAMTVNVHVKHSRLIEEEM